MQAHEIDYQIFEEMQYVEIELDPQEIVIAEAGSFMMMDNKSKWKRFFEMVQNKIGSWPTLNAVVKSSYRRKLFMTALSIKLIKRKVSLHLLRKILIDLTEFQGKFICQKLLSLRSKRCICWN
jgi:uncharacterized protein (AIM24 family)